MKHFIVVNGVKRQVGETTEKGDFLELAAAIMHEPFQRNLMNYRILKHRHANYGTPESRKKLVDMLSLMIEGRKDSTFEPYMPNSPDDMFWTLDSANNFKVKFHADKPDSFELIYRYGHEHVQTFGDWLKVRFGYEDPVIAAAPVPA